MRYFGSKVSTIKSLYDLISTRVSSGTFCDPFGGIGSVGAHFQSKGYSVWSGDVLTSPHFFQISKLKFSQSHFHKKLLNHLGLKNHNDIENLLNSSAPKAGWFTREYSEKRLFFTDQNAKKIQACRSTIKNWAKKGWLSHDEHAVLLASLINSMDKVANTAGTYYAYLKKWNRKAINNFRFEFIIPVSSENKGQCFLEPANSLVKRRHFDILYLDPPYNERSYPHYYHLPETIAREATPSVHGLSGIPKNISGRSQFNSTKEAKRALIDLLDNANFNLLVFHYADNGIISPEDVQSILSAYGEVEDFMIDTNVYTSKKTSRKMQHHIHILQHA